LPTYAQIHRKKTKQNRKEEEWVHIYFKIVDVPPATLNANVRVLCSLGSLLLKFMLQVL
jgi:hypothetical protein